MNLNLILSDWGPNLPKTFTEGLMVTKGLMVTEESSEVTASPYACRLYFSRQDTNNAENYIPKGHHQFCKSL